MKAWIENEAVRDICPGNPDELYRPDIAKLYDTEVPEGTKQGATKINGVWTNPVVPEPVPVPPAPVLIPLIGPIAFQMLFTIQEAVAADTAKATDPAVRIFWKLLDDPRTDVVDRNLPSLQAMIQHLEDTAIIGPGRAQQIIHA